MRIACWAKGDGLPLILLPPLPGHLQLDAETFRDTNESFVRRRYRLIRFDRRGSGLSGHTANWTLEEFMLDLEAVLASFSVSKCAILAYGPSSIQAIGFAARRPERVSHLVLWEGIGAFEQIATGSQMRALIGLLESDHVLFTETIANVFFGWAAGDRARSYAAALRASLTPEELRRGTRLLASLDARPLLNGVRAPTLIVHHRGAAIPPMEAVRELAASIVDARLVILEGDTVAGDFDTPQAREVIDEFLLGAAPADDVAFARADQGEAAADRSAGFRTIIFTDLEGSTALTERLGDARARDLLRERERVVRRELREHSGSDVKTMGDGFMASFTSATKSLECAVAIQRAVEEGRASPGSARADWHPLRVRIGLNAGEPVAEEGELFGTSVNLAARIAAAAEGGEILVSDVVRQLVAGKGFVFADRGAVPMKGFEDPVRLYEVRWRASSIEELSERERQVLECIAAGMSNEEIAEHLVVALSTVKTHINNIYGKLGVRSRTQAIVRSQDLHAT